MSFQDRTIIISVEGNISSGKTLLLRELAQNAAIHVIFEPEQMWRDLKKQYNLLAHFYRDRSRWTYSFQTMAFIGRTQAIMHANILKAGAVLISERSVFSDRYCFAQASKNLGHMSEMEWRTYQQWFDWLAPSRAVIPDGFIYLRSDPADCLQRIKQSERAEERIITNEYVNALHECHEAWLLPEADLGPTIASRPVLIIEREDFLSTFACNATNDFIQMLEDQMTLPIINDE